MGDLNGGLLSLDWRFRARNLAKFRVSAMKSSSLSAETPLSTWTLRTNPVRESRELWRKTRADEAGISVGKTSGEGETEGREGSRGQVRLGEKITDWPRERRAPKGAKKSWKVGVWQRGVGLDGVGGSWRASEASSLRGRKVEKGPERAEPERSVTSSRTEVKKDIGEFSVGPDVPAAIFRTSEKKKSSDLEAKDGESERRPRQKEVLGFFGKF